MKNFIYLLTLLFNAFGFFFGLSFLFCISLDNILLLQLIFISCLVFGMGFCITLTDFVHRGSRSEKKKYLFNLIKNRPVIIDYKDYFLSRKSDFIIK